MPMFIMLMPKRNLLPRRSEKDVRDNMELTRTRGTAYNVAGRRRDTGGLMLAAGLCREASDSKGSAYNVCMHDAAELHKHIVHRRRYCSGSN